MTNFIRVANQLCSKMSSRIISPVTIRYSLQQGFNNESFNPLAADVSIDKEVYNLSLDKSQYDVEYTLHHIGNKSITLKYDIFFPHFDKSLATGRFRIVFVNPETRKPCLIPSWWMDKYLPFAPTNTCAFVASSAPELEEEENNSVTVQVLPTHIDSNFHVGWYFQIKILLDAYSHWHFRRFGFEAREGMYRSIKYMNVLYKSEALLGDDLDIAVKAARGNKNNFQLIMRKGKRIISESYIKFYPTNLQN